MLLDVSQPVRVGASHFPGDEPFSCGWTLGADAGDNLNLGWVKSSPHVGTHVDAPFHFDARGARVGGLPLDAFVGRAVVVDARGCSALDAELLGRVDLSGGPRVLFRTQERTDPSTFLESFPVLTGGAVDLLARAGVRLVGVDAPSVDPVDAKRLAVHEALGRAGILNIENLRLDDAAPGAYELLAAPVAWVEMDAAPVRALLRR